ncbi:MAG: polymer-forming cytoskeletal protein, partial [Erysipelotrichaceae bacterium]|nr:polymer-forming cytoskeletal protein [Erysipelotrichaceae bacterium]
WGVNGTFTFPNGTILPAGGISVIDIKSASSVSNPSVNFFGAGLTGNPQSSGTQGYYIKDAQGNIIDAAATNGQAFDPSTGVTASDWTGSITGLSGQAGMVRVISDNNTASDWLGTSGTSASFGSVNPQLGATSGGFGCESNRVPITVNVIGFPSIDAGISQITSPIGSVPSGSLVDIDVELTNFGLNTLTSADIVWALNNVIQDTIHWTGSLPYQHSDTITLANTSFNGGVYTIKSWTSIPNLVADTINTNDTTIISFNSCLSGTYTIGKPANGTFDFPSFNDAKNALMNAGVCGHVIFNVDTGSYTEQLNFGAIPGAGPNSTITFQSANSDSSSVILSYSGTSTDNYTIYLNGADYMTFRGMTIKALNTSYGTVIQLANGAHRNTFENNELISIGTSSNNRVVYDYTTLNNYNTYRNNLMKNGYYSLYIYGASTASWQKGTVIEGNLVVEGNAELYGEVHGNIKCSHHINIFGSVKGNVVAESGEINEGFVSGDVSTKLHLVIGNKTEVLGNIDSKSAIINGKVKGDCTLTDVVSITGTGVVLGNISTKDLSVDQGAIIQGNIKINRDVFFESDDE